MLNGKCPPNAWKDGIFAKIAVWNLTAPRKLRIRAQRAILGLTRSAVSGSKDHFMLLRENKSRWFSVLLLYI